MGFINKHILTIFIFLFVSVNVISQNKKIDSLKIELENHTANDTTRINLLYDLAYAHFRQDISKTKNYLKTADSLSTILNYSKGKARVSYLKGILENIKSNYTQSLHFFEESLKQYQSIQDKKGIADVYTAFGITNYDLSKYTDAILNYKQATEIYKALNNKREVATNLINTGNVYSEIGQYQEAISNYKEALILSEIIDDEDGISFVHRNLGVVYKVQGNYPLAIESFNKSLEYNKKTKNDLSVASILNNLGEIYTILKKYDKALDHHKQSLTFSTKAENKKLTAANYSNIGTVFLQKKAYAKAIEYFNRSIAISSEINDLKHVSITYINIGNTYLKQNKPIVARKNYTKAKDISEETNNKRILSSSLLGIAKTYLQEKYYKKALALAFQGLEIAKELNLLESQKTASEILTEVYHRTGQYKKAFESHQELKMLNDSLFNKENIEKIAQLEYDYKYKQAIDAANIRELKLTKTVLTTSKNLEKSKRNYLWAIISFLVVSIASVSFIFYEKLRNAKAIAQNIIIEQKLLRSQMTPHFIFNSLSVLQGIILNKEERKSVSYLSKFSRLLRLTLENSRDKTVLLSKELMAVESYLALQNLENNSYQHSITIADSVDSDTTKIPPMLIQPFVENAIEHAFSDDAINKEIHLILSMVKEQLICTITDNGIGIDAQKKQKNKAKKSLSTVITSERLKMLSKDFKMKGSVTIQDRKIKNEKGTIVTLVIPYKKENLS